MTKSLMLKDGQLKDGQLGVVQGVGAPVFSGVQPGAVLPHTSEFYTIFGLKGDIFLCPATTFSLFLQKVISHLSKYNTILFYND